MKKNKKTIAIAAVLVIVAALAIYINRARVTPINNNNSKVAIVTTSGNYGRFIDNIDNSYFSTQDSNVKSLIETYLVWTPGKTDAEKYGRSLVYYYDTSRFIEAQKVMPNDDSSVSSYVLRNIQNGEIVPGCVIYKDSGLYKGENILLSISFLNEKQGICIYEKGSSNFNFVDLSSKLAGNETLFKDPAGQLMTASITNVDTKKRIISIGVYSKDKKDSQGNYSISKNINVSF